MPESFLNKVAGPRPATLLKKKLWHRCFPVNFVNFLTLFRMGIFGAAPDGGEQKGSLFLKSVTHILQ